MNFYNYGGYPNYAQIPPSIQPQYAPQMTQQAQQQPSGGNSGGGIAGSYGGDYLDQNPEFGYSSGIDWTQDNSNGENNNITD